jgi:peptidoglycan/LPS O-acetylase OafA/YrhL
LDGLRGVAVLFVLIGHELAKPYIDASASIFFRPAASDSQN